MNTPVIILVQPQMAENIGAVARAMMNCAHSELRLVAPRDGWPQPNAYPTASGADEILNNARLYETLTDAVADLHYVLATTANHREQVKPVYAPSAAGADLCTRISTGQNCGILFGPERAGLDNTALTHANALITVPLNPEFASLNLAQAVLLIAWEFHKLNTDAPPRTLQTNGAAIATKKELELFLARLEQTLDVAGFFTTEAQRPSMLRNLRNLFQRADITEQELRTLHGVITALRGNG